MPNIPIRDVGKYGILTDRPAHEIPSNAWTRCRNVRAKDGFIERVGGEAEVFKDAAPIEAPWNLFYSPNIVGTPYWVYGGTTKVGVADADSHYDITPLGFSFAASDLERWTGTWLNGVFIMNTKANECHVWTAIEPTTPIRLTPMSEIPNTEFQPDWRFNSMRTFKEIMIGIGFTDGGISFPSTVLWSGPATPGNVPIEWDEANLNNIAGAQPLSATPGRAIDGMQLGNRFILCKEDATYVASFTQGAQALAFNHIDLNSGVMALHCMKEYRAGYMLILNQNADVMITDGIGVKSILSKRLRNQMQSSIDVDRIHQAFVQVNPFKEEVWICYPIAGDVEDQAGEALIWNYADNTFTNMSLGALTHLNFGKVGEEGLPFINDVDVLIDQADYLVDGGGLIGAYAVLGCSHPRNQFYQVDVGVEINAAPYTCTIERMNIALIGSNSDKTERVDHNRVKVCTGIWPVVETAGVSLTMQISVGGQERRDGPVDWDGPYDFDPETDQAIDFMVEGVYIAVKFECSASEAWKLHGYSIEVDVVGDKL